jgi:two-component system OmpR family response regulator
MAEGAPRILVVDDDRSIREAVCGYLQRRGMSAVGAADAPAMEEALATTGADLVVLDLMMPGEDGLSICRRISPHVPVLMLSAMGETSDRIVGLEMGADDYLAKPFDPRELLARIGSILRRRSALSSQEQREVYSFSGWKFDPSARELRGRDGLQVSVTGGEASLLHVFLRHPRQVLTRDQLLDLSRGPLSESYDRAVDLAVSRLRRKLNLADAELIETVRGEGYRFIAPVTKGVS